MPDFERVSERKVLPRRTHLPRNEGSDHARKRWQAHEPHLSATGTIAWA